MITSITLENFKGVREPVTLSIKPITLLFGPNSAGKSTFLHALHYASEIFESHNLDADLTLTGGPFIDRGGFKSLVHGRDYSLPVRIGFEVAMQQLAWVGFGGDVSVIGDLVDLPFRHFLASPLESASVTVEIRWSPYEQRPYVSSTTVSLNGEPFATLQCEPNLTQRFLKFLGTDISAFQRVKDCADFDKQDENTDFSKTVFTRAIEELQYRLRISSDRRLAIAPSRIPDGLPAIDEPLAAFWDEVDDDDSAIRSGPSAYGYESRRQVSECCKQFMLAVSELFLAPCQAVRAGLNQMLYLGPIREAPSRHERPRVINPGQWATGRAAWDLLGECDEWLVNAVSEWLGDAERLNTGYTVKRREFYEIDVDDPIVATLRAAPQFDADYDERSGPAESNLGRFPISRQLYLVPRGKKLLLRPQDVGTGIAQVLPVVVALLDGKQRLICIEQPELHLHPRVQAGLADLVIEAAISHRHNVLLETHSELIPLRLMRRIRECLASAAATERTLITSADVHVAYVETHEGATILTTLVLGKDGSLLDPWPDGFFEDGFNERFGQ